MSEAIRMGSIPDANVEFHQWVFSEAGRKAARDAVVSQYAWYYHVAPISAITGIQASGLKPFPLQVADAKQDEVIAVYGKVPDMLCLNPMGTAPVASSGEGPFMRLAVSSADLPRFVCVDWSYSGHWALPEIIRQDAPKATNEQLFLQTISRGSVGVVDPIAKEALRVLASGFEANSPDQWPLLKGVAAKGVALCDSYGLPQATACSD